MENLNLGFCSDLGTNIFSKSDAAVVVMPGFYEADKEAFHYEISHIKHNDTFTV